MVRIPAPTLYDTTGSISQVARAWTCGQREATIAELVILMKAGKSLAVCARNSSLHNKNRHLPQLVEVLINSGATAEQGARLMTQIASHFELTLDQMREYARLLNGKTAKTDTGSGGVEAREAGASSTRCSSRGRWSDSHLTGPTPQLWTA